MSRRGHKAVIRASSLGEVYIRDPRSPDIIWTPYRDTVFRAGDRVRTGALSEAGWGEMQVIGPAGTEWWQALYPDGEVDDGE